MPATVPISVAIPCFGHEAALKETIRHIMLCDPLPQEVLLHYDGGWEPKEDCSTWSTVPVRCIRSPVNLGPGGGRDVLFRAAACDIVASFDDDSWPVDADYFAKALALMQAFPNVAVISPAVYLREKPLLPPLPEANEVVSFEGSASITRRSHYLKLPGYVPVPQAYGVEEADLSLQVHAAGLDILNSPWLRAWHERPYSDYQHSLVPWIRNEVLLVYLRYPRWLQPWGLLRSVRHVVSHFTKEHGSELLRALISSLAHCQHHKASRRRYRFREIRRHHFRKERRWTLKPTVAGLEIRLAVPGKRVLYLQYTNPAGYPPLEHSSQILAADGWEVLFLGIADRKVKGLAFPPHPRIVELCLPWCPPGMRQKLHYLRYSFSAAWYALRFRPNWIYCSDPLSASPGLLARRVCRAKIIYHEHDTPAEPVTREKWFARFCRNRRQQIARLADVVVLPNQERLNLFKARLAPEGKDFCIWNCPSLHDLPEQTRQREDSAPLRVLYHGSIVPDRFPLSRIHALAQCCGGVVLRLMGYEVQGSIGYTEQLKAEAARLGVAEQFECLGTIPLRKDLMARCAECDVGLALLQHESSDINMQHMAGASNKPFDYLSQGLALIVPISAEWQRIYVAAGCALACEPDDAGMLAAQIRQLRDDRAAAQRMGETGQRLIRETWNYEAQFAPLKAHMETEAPTSTRRAQGEKRRGERSY